MFVAKMRNNNKFWLEKKNKMHRKEKENVEYFKESEKLK